MFWNSTRKQILKNQNGKSYWLLLCIDDLVYIQHLNPGINLTTSKYTDGTDYDSGSYDFEGDNVKFENKLCVYAKRGIGFKARGSDCTDYMNYYCLWNRKYFDISSNKIMMCSGYSFLFIKLILVALETLAL